MNPLTHSAHTSDAAGQPGGPLDDGRGELSIGVAQRCTEVIDAWRLVYRSYRRTGIIDANEAELHTTPLAIDPRTSVILGNAGDELAATLSIMHDAGRGLPLDTVYARELGEMRQRGERLLEVGLFADRRARMARSVMAIFGMMRFVFYSARFTGSTILAGVHPHHAGFYVKSFGFEVVGEPSTYPVVKDQPIVLLRGDWEKQLRADPLPRGLVEYVNRPLPVDTFESRFQLTPASIAGTPIEQFLAMKSQPPAIPALRAAG